MQFAHIRRRVIYLHQAMKQPQFEPTRCCSTTRAQADNVAVPQVYHGPSQSLSAFAQPQKLVRSPSARQLGSSLLAALWFTVTLPFRVTFWIIAWLGRLTAALLGFLLMVLGVALWAGPLFFVGIPLFVVGLVLTLRCLE
jgi:hypothetical protein